MALVIILASLLIGLSKGGLGGPVPVALITPLLSQVMPAGQAVGIALPMLLFADMLALAIYWRQWDNRLIQLMLPVAITGVIAGSALLGVLAQQDLLFRRVLGGFTLLVVVYKIGSGALKTLRYQPRNWHGYLAGWASGFGSALANVGAPPFTAYMLLQRLDPVVFVGTTTLFFAIVNLLKLPGVLLTGTLDLRQFIGVLWALPFIPLGVWLGRRFILWVNPVFFERVMLALLFGMGLFMLFSTPFPTG